MHPDQRTVVFANGALDLAGTLHLPRGFDDSGSYPALVIATPGSSVKEQIGATYGSRLASRGYVVLTFDPSYQGASGGEPRDLEDPAARVEDIRCAVDFLTTQGCVDAARIGLLGICAGGGYAANAAMTEHRIKALGVVVPINIGRARRQAPLSPTSAAEVLAAVGEARTVAARTGEHQRRPWIPDTPEAARDAGITDPDLLDAIDYYRTPRGQHANSTNRILFRSMGAMMSFDAFHLVEELLIQPTCVIVGGRLGLTFSYADGQTLWERARNRAGFVVIPGAGHYDLYDKPEYIEPAVERLVAFYNAHL